MAIHTGDPTLPRYGTDPVQQLLYVADPNTELELDDVQSGVLRPRPTPYVAIYIGCRIDDRKTGRELMHQRVAALRQYLKSKFREC